MELYLRLRAQTLRGFSSLQPLCLNRFFDSLRGRFRGPRSLSKSVFDKLSNETRFTGFSFENDTVLRQSD